MPEKYKPRILVQGAILVAPDGSVHSPMYEEYQSNKHLLALNHWELTPEGVKKAADYAGRHRVSKISEEWAKNISKAGMAEGDSHKKVSRMLQVVGLKESDDEAVRLVQPLLKPSYGDSKDVAEALLKLRLDRIAQSPEEFIEHTKQEKKKITPARWKRGAQRVADAIQTGGERFNELPFAASVILGGGTAISVLGGVTMGMANGILYLGGEDPVIPEVNMALLAGGAGGAALYATPYATSAMAGKARKMTRHTPEASEKKGRAHIAALEEIIAEMPKKTQTLLAYYDPIFFIADRSCYYNGNQRREEESAFKHYSHALGEADAYGNSIFGKTSQVTRRQVATFFEESRHLIHSLLMQEKTGDRDNWHKWGRAMAEAFNEDIRFPAAETFVSAHALKRYGGNIKFWEREAYEGYEATIGVEVMAECDHIALALQKKGMTEEQSLQEMAKYLPNVMKEYRKMLALENRKLAEIESAQHGVNDAESTVLRDREINRRNNGPSQGNRPDL